VTGESRAAGDGERESAGTRDHVKAVHEQVGANGLGTTKRDR
jgi:hypothetical protein